ncbi:MAG: F0F1 ATP synthase subunit delta [Opitutales bacterium]|nr:F0F1 ATP synthase subunit delta [Opitutales bacterium]
MKISKKYLKSVAEKLLGFSRDSSGTVDAERVRVILAELPKFYRQQPLRELLKLYYAAVAKDLRFSELRLEYVGDLPAGTAESLAEHFSQVYKRKIIPVTEQNPSLLGGMRASVGDDVIDASLATVLKRL